MKKKIKNFFLGIKSKFEKKEYAEIKRKTINFSQANHIAVLIFSVDGKINTRGLEQIIKNLKAQNKQVHVLAYFETPQNRPENFVYDSFTGQEISLTGEIKSAFVKDFLNQPYDYLYCLNLQDSLVVKHCMQNTKAKCRVGKHYFGQESYFELMVSVQENAQDTEIFEQMIALTDDIKHNVS